VFDADGRFRGYRVTEQQQLTLELQHREAYLVEAQRLSQTGSCTESRPGYQLLVGGMLPCSEFRSTGWFAPIRRILSADHPDDQPGFRELIQTAICEKAEWEGTTAACVWTAPSGTFTSWVILF
jgi:hypothetical protein